jgi:hypothetical protein
MLSSPAAKLRALRRIASPEPDPSAVDLQRITIDHAGPTDHIVRIGALPHQVRSSEKQINSLVGINPLRRRIVGVEQAVQARRARFTLPCDTCGSQADLRADAPQYLVAAR